MGLMDTLNNLTQQMNNAVDKITNSNAQGVQGAPVNQGLAGLGVVNENNSNGNMQSPAGFMDKADTDVRKLVTFIDRFTDNSQYVEYLSKWFTETGLFTVTPMNNCISLQMNTNVNNQNKWFTETGLFVVTPMNNCISLQMNTNVNNQTFVANYTVYGCINQSEVDTVLQSISMSPNMNGVTIILGYINFNDNEIRTAKQYNIQLIGIEGILEINHAIELADSRLPYVTFDKSSFLHMLASALHNKYKMAQQCGGNTFDNMTNSMSASLNNFGERTSEALSGFAAGVGLSKAVNTESNQQVVKNEEQLAEELANTMETQQAAQSNGVSLEKSNDTVQTNGVSLEKNNGVSLEKSSGVSLEK